MSTSPGNILSQIDKAGELRAREGKLDDYEPTPEGARKNAKSESNHHSSHGVLVTGISQISLVNSAEREAQGECWGVRHTMFFLSLLGLALSYSMRVNLSIAIVSMIKSESKNIINTSDTGQVCLAPDEYDTSEKGNEVRRANSTGMKQPKGHILGAFYYGYLVGNLFGGKAAEHFGGKHTYAVGVVFTGILTLLSPLSAKVHTGLFFMIQVFQGFSQRCFFELSHKPGSKRLIMMTDFFFIRLDLSASQGFILPALNCLLAKWIPPLERTKFTSATNAGAELGIMVAMPVSGWLCDTDFLGGWPSAFYVFGTLGIIWGIPWYFLVYSTPDLHPRITVAEEAYIKKSCVYNNNNEIPIPWKAIFTSTPFLAILVAHIGFNWGYLHLLAMLPTYLKNIQNFDITSNGALSALPYLMMWFYSMFYSNFMSYLQINGKLSTINIRRLSMALSMYGPMLALVAMCFVNCNQVLAMVVICIAVGLSGSVYSGYSCSHQDIAPNLGGTLMGFTCGFASLSGILSPIITGWIINRTQTLSAWRIVFLISSAVYMIAGTIYIVFVSTEIQPWNFPKVKSNDKAEGKEESKL